jgi:peroxiredoxin
MKNLFACVLFFLAVYAAFAQSAPGDNDKFKAAQKAYQEKKYEDAAHGFEQANKALGGHCSQCLLFAADAYGRANRRDDALKLAAKAVDTAVETPDKVAALIRRSQLLLKLAPGAKELALAETQAKMAVDLQPDSPVTHYALGLALLRQKKDEAAISELKWVESHLPDGADKQRVQALIADPRRAREPVAPAFTALTSDGKQIMLADLKGKVVLIDFWDTSCSICRTTIPEIKELRRKYGTQLIVLSISSDEKKEDWSQFIAKHDMNWLQSWDKGNKPSVQEAFDVHSSPTYVLLDGDGIVRERINDLDEQQALTSRLRDQLTKLMK